MSAESGWRVAQGADSDGELLARALEISLRRGPHVPRHVVDVDFALGEWRDRWRHRERWGLKGRGSWDLDILSIEVVRLRHPEDFSRRPERPFVRVRVVTPVHGGIVRDDQDLEVVRTGVCQLMRAARWMEEDVA